jgi:citrate synthase
MAHWAELVRDPEQVIARPRQVYIGEAPRAYLPIDRRPEPSMREDAVSEKI